MLRQYIVNIVLLAVFLGIGNGAMAQLSHQLFPYRDGDKWGYCNRDGKVMIPPQWDRADPFGHFSARVKVGNSRQGYYCLIDEKGEYIIPPELHWTGYWNISSSGDVMNINDSNGHVGRVDTNGNIIIPMVYDEVGSRYAILGGDFYRVYQNGKQGVIRKDGSKVLPCIYQEVWHSSPVGLSTPSFLVKTNDSTSALVDINGKTLISFSPIRTPTFRHTDTHNTVYYEVHDTYWIWEHFPKGTPREIPYRLEWLYLEGNIPFATIYSIRGENGKLGFANSKGAVLVAPRYDNVFVDTGMRLMAENKLDNNNPDEQYEYTYLDTTTLKPIGVSIKSAESGIKQAENRINDQYYSEEEEPEHEGYWEEETDEQPEIKYNVTHTKGSYLLHVHNMQESYSTQERLLAVTVMDTNKNVLGHTLTDIDLNFKMPPQPYRFFDVEDLNQYMHTIILEHENKFALADTNLNILIDFQDWYPIPNTYFKTNGKHYAIVTMSSEETIRDLGEYTYVQLVGGDGKTIPGLEQQYYVSIMNNENLWGRTIEHLAVKNSNGMTGIVDLQGKLLYPEISYRYPQLSQLADNLFKTSLKDGSNIKLINRKNRNLFPNSTIRRVEFAEPYYFYSSGYHPIPGIFILHFKNDMFFYINQAGKPFAKNVTTTAQLKR